MVNYFIYAKDYSYSTDGVPFYHSNGLKSLKQFKSDVDKIKSELKDPEKSQLIFLHWGHQCLKVDEQTAVEKYEKRVGNDMDTLPETIIQWIKKNIKEDDKIKLMYIITDGLIGNQSASKCLALNETVSYEKVVFHAFHQNFDCIDLSVAASFLKGHCTTYRNYELMDDIDVSKEFDYSTITPDNFGTEKENLKSYIRIKFISAKKNDVTALVEIDKLKTLRKRLFKELSSGKESTIEATDKDTFLREFMNTNWYKNFISPTYDLKTDIEKSISTLINYIVCEKKSYSFDALKFETKFKNEVSEEPIVDVNFATDQEIEFPDIILNDDKGIPVILCIELNLLDKLIFNNSESSASFSKFKSIMDCPLFLLNNTDLNESVGYFYTLNVYKQLLAQPVKTEPRSRRPFHGGLVLVDTDDFDAYNDYILSATYFDFKKVNYNVGLFYFVLWKIAEKKQWMDRNVVEQFKKYMLRRVTKTVCKIGLSALPLDPPFNASLPTALWYCVELSSSLFKDDPIRFTHERLRMYCGVAHYMIEILNYLQYNLDITYIEKRKDLMRHVVALKKIPQQRDKIYYFIEKIFKKVDGFLISEIESFENVNKLNYLKLNHKEMLNDDIIKEKVNLNDYVNFLHDTGNSEVPLCEKTFRPYFVIDENKSFYSELFKMSKKVDIKKVGKELTISLNPIDEIDFNRILSVYNLFLRCVKDTKKYPTLEEFKEYIIRKKKFKKDLVNIFAVNVLQEIERAFLSYEKVIKDVDFSEFVKTCDKYVNRLERIKGENKRKFESDNEIQMFIYDEEFKNKVKKM